MKETGRLYDIKAPYGPISAENKAYVSKVVALFQDRLPWSSLTMLVFYLDFLFNV